jgi:prephenate dehydratase
VRIVGEEILPISHALIARPGVALRDITAVVSHPQALGQCRRFLSDTLPGARSMAATSTAEAVRTIAESREPWAAIGATVAAKLHRVDVVAEGIEDEHGNETRFLWVSPAAAGSPFPEDPAGPYKTSIVFHGSGDATPGWLVDSLSELSRRRINMTRIESRPLKRQLGHYLFLVDFEGHEDDQAVGEALVGLHAHAEVLRVVPGGARTALSRRNPGPAAATVPPGVPVPWPSSRHHTRWGPRRPASTGDVDGRVAGCSC